VEKEKYEAMFLLHNFAYEKQQLKVGGNIPFVDFHQIVI